MNGILRVGQFNKTNFHLIIKVEDRLCFCKVRFGLKLNDGQKKFTPATPIIIARHGKQALVIFITVSFQIWESPQIRPTMDIDMLGRTSNKLSDVVSEVIDILSIDVDPDGFSFSPEEITAENITDEAEYQGVRIQFPAKLDTMTLNMQLDIGYGDIIHPSPEESELSSILGFAAPRLLCYSRESAIAEKFEAMLKLRELNRRMKDFYDIWLLCRQFGFNGKTHQKPSG